MTRSQTKSAAEADDTPRPDRRARRRQETIEEILDIAREVMSEEGVNGLSLAEVARRLGVQPPSLYKYFPSLMAIYDALFLRGQLENLAEMRAGMAGAEPGLDALIAGLEASGRWALANRAVAELLFWRPVPSFHPSEEAFAPSVEMVELQRRALADAVVAGQLGPDANNEDARLPRVDPHRRRAQPGVRQRARPPLGRGSLHSHFHPPHAPPSPLSSRCRRDVDVSEIIGA